jgi:hypothetical protein
MGKDCFVLADEDFVLNLLTNSSLRDKYQEYTFSDHVKVCFVSYQYFPRQLLKNVDFSRPITLACCTSIFSCREVAIQSQFCANLLLTVSSCQRNLVALTRWYWTSWMLMVNLLCITFDLLNSVRFPGFSTLLFSPKTPAGLYGDFAFSKD